MSQWQLIHICLVRFLFNKSVFSVLFGIQMLVLLIDCFCPAKPKSEVLRSGKCFTLPMVSFWAPSFLYRIFLYYVLSSYCIQFLTPYPSLPETCFMWAINYSWLDVQGHQNLLLYHDFVINWLKFLITLSSWDSTFFPEETSRRNVYNQKHGNSNIALKVVLFTQMEVDVLCGMFLFPM